MSSKYTEEMLGQMVACVHSKDVLQKHMGIIGIRKILYQQVNPPIEELIGCGILDQCMELAKQNEFPQLKLEATWILVVIAAGKSPLYCEKIVEKGGIDLFISLLVANQYGVVDQAIWGIGNLAADKIIYRDEILQKGGIDALMKIINLTKSNDIIKSGVWAITNLCRGKPLPSEQMIKNVCQLCGLLCKVIKSGILETNNSK
jgi:hypothetical protein